MVGIPAETGRHQPCQAVLDLADGPSWGEPQPIGDPKDMGIDGDGRFAKGGIQDDVGGLAPNPWERQEMGPVSWDLAIVVAHQLLAGPDDMAGLGAIEADAADISLEPILSQSQKAGCIRSGREQGPRGLVDASVRRLG